MARVALVLVLAFTTHLAAAQIPRRSRDTVPAQPPSEEEKLPAALAELMKAKPLKPAPGDDDLRKLLKERYNTALEVLQYRVEEYNAGRRSSDYLADTARLILDVKLDLAERPADRVAVREQYVELTRWIEKYAEVRAKSPSGSPIDLLQARYLRLGAEVELLKEKRAAKGR
jgi:hypothetical protein